jgi:hypothetical protein
MRLEYVRRVEEWNRSDLDSHAYCCVCGKEVLVFNDFDREVTVTGWDPEGETQSLRNLSAAMGYTIPNSGKNVPLIVHQSIFIVFRKRESVRPSKNCRYDVPTERKFRPTFDYEKDENEKYH